MIQRYAPQVVLGCVVLMGVVGVIFFYLALRPCIVDIAPGKVIRYELVKQIFADGDDDQEDVLLREQRSEIALIMLAADGTAALLVDSGAHRRSEVQYVEVKRTGQVLLRHEDVTHSYGPAVGYFDFNLMSLPPGLDQARMRKFTIAIHRQISAAQHPYSAHPQWLGATFSLAPSGHRMG